MLLFVIILLIIGLIAGAVARLLVPGRDPIGVIGTIVLGIVGSLVGGFLEELIFQGRISHHLRLAGIIGSIVGAVIVLLILRFSGLERGHRRRRVRI